MLKHKEKKRHTFGDFDELAFDQNGLEENHGPVEDNLDFKSGLRRVDFEGLKQKDRLTDERKAAMGIAAL